MLKIAQTESYIITRILPADNSLCSIKPTPLQVLLKCSNESFVFGGPTQYRMLVTQDTYSEGYSIIKLLFAGLVFQWLGAPLAPPASGSIKVSAAVFGFSLCGCVTHLNLESDGTVRPEHMLASKC